MQNPQQFAPMQNLQQTADIMPKETLYINNLNDKIKPEEQKINLYFLFCQFGEIVQIICKKRSDLRGQAFIIFKSTTSATQALKTLQGFKINGKPIKIAYSKQKSEILAKLDGTYVPPKVNTKEKLKRIKIAPQPPGSKKIKKDQQQDQNQQQNNQQQNQFNQIQQDTEQSTNNVLFIENLPPQATDEMMIKLFSQYDGFKEIRLISAKQVAFAEYDSDQQAQYALMGLNGFKITSDYQLKVSYAKI